MIQFNFKLATLDGHRGTFVTPTPPLTNFGDTISDCNFGLNRCFCDPSSQSADMRGTTQASCTSRQPTDDHGTRITAAPSSQSDDISGKTQVSRTSRPRTADTKKRWASAAPNLMQQLQQRRSASVNEPRLLEHED